MKYDSIAVMNKKEAIDLLGGTVTAAADALGVNYQAVRQWPDPLPPRIADRVLGCLARTKLTPKALDKLTSQPDPITTA